MANYKKKKKFTNKIRKRNLKRAQVKRIKKQRKNWDEISRDAWKNIFGLVGIDNNFNIIIPDSSFLLNVLGTRFQISPQLEKILICIPRCIEEEIRKMRGERIRGINWAREDLRESAYNKLNNSLGKWGDKSFIFDLNDFKFDKSRIMDLIDDVQKKKLISPEYSKKLSREDKTYILSIIIFFQNIDKIRSHYKFDLSQFNLILALLDVRMAETIRHMFLSSEYQNELRIPNIKKYIENIFLTVARVRKKADYMSHLRLRLIRENLPPYARL